MKRVACYLILGFIVGSCSGSTQSPPATWDALLTLTVAGGFAGGRTDLEIEETGRIVLYNVVHGERTPVEESQASPEKLSELSQLAEGFESYDPEYGIGFPDAFWYGITVVRDSEGYTVATTNPYSPDLPESLRQLYASLLELRDDIVNP